MIHRVSIAFAATLLICSILPTFNIRAEEPVRRPQENSIFGMILEHAKELELTEDQKKQITDFKNDYVARRENMANDPQIKELYEKAKAARENRDEAQMGEIQRALRERQTALFKGDKPTGNPMELLTDSQRQKLRELEAQMRTQRPGAEGGRAQAGMTAKILENAEALNVTEEQKAQLTESRVIREKIEGDAELRTLFGQVRESATNFDDAKVAALMEKIRSRKAGIGADKPTKSPLEILSEEQRQKLQNILTRREVGNGERKPEAKRDGERNPEAKREGDRKPEARRDGEGERKPEAKRDGDRNSEAKRDGDRKPEARRDGEGERKPEAKRDGDRNPEAKRDGDRKPEALRDGEGERKPDAKRDGDGERKPEAKRDGDRREPEKKDANDAPSPTIRVKPNNDL